MTARRSRRVMAAMAEVEERMASIDLEATRVSDEVLAASDALRREGESIARVLRTAAEVARAQTDALVAARADLLQIADNPDAYPDLVGALWAEKEAIVREMDTYRLTVKKSPAIKAAEAVALVRDELAREKVKRKRAEAVIALHRFDFPWLVDFYDFPSMDDDEQREARRVPRPDSAGEDPDVDPVRRFLSSEEYQALDDNQRHQLALDRYLVGRKSRWEIGRDYEMFVAYQWAQRGYAVRYQGILDRYEDLGRDVIARSGNDITIIQCKYWSRAKTLRENSVFQLAGTVAAAQLDTPHCNVVGRIVTSTSLSPVAHMFAEKLGVEVDDGMELGPFPRVKCNVARTSGERIFHLPMDHAYDATVIEPERGEFFAWSIEEATSAGFRRSWRWKPTRDD